MKNPTEMMKSILTNEKAQEIIDYISPIYGNSYVGLWIFQALGTVLGEIYTIAAALRYETNPVTADLMLDYWEKHYKIPTDTSLTKEQRQLRLASKIRSRGPCNPTKLAFAISAALGGVGVDITENVAKNTFLVNIRDVVDDITPAVAVLEKMKPAHLIYQIQVATQMVASTDLKVAIAATHKEMNIVDVQYTGTHFELNQQGTLLSFPSSSLEDGVLEYDTALKLNSNGVLTT